MHNNFYFLRQLSDSLRAKLIGFTVVSCFSQNKEELILELNNERESFFIKASLQPNFCCLCFPKSFNRAKKNSIDLFNEVLIKKVVGVRQFANERSFALELEGGFALIFKMHGNLANIVLLNDDQVTEIFRNQFQDDYKLHLDKLDRTIDWSKEYFESNLNNLAKAYFTLGKDVCQQLENQFAFAHSTSEKWNLFQATLKQLTQPNFYIIDKNGTPALSLLLTDHVIAQFTDPVEAINDLFYRYTSSHSFSIEKSKVQRAISEGLKRAESYIQKNLVKLNQIENDQHYQLWGDLIMAHMHEVKIGTKTISLTNFYTNAEEEIKLKAELNAQQNAEAFYRKAKNQQIEINKLKESIGTKQNELSRLKNLLDQIEMATDFKSLKPLVNDKPDKKKGNSQKALPYHTFEYQGFQIWVGKNAEANDELTQKYSFKEDLWLHAKDVAGSHVLIKHQSGKNFPKDVIARAAELAAYNSKRKTDSLCPVAFTPKKFVRKRKGDPAGMVVVEKENVIMVVPKL